VHILIVEDEAALGEGLRFNFEREGYSVILAANGPAALSALEVAEPPIDLVVMDLMLPGMSGYEICKAIRQRDATLPILVLSARRQSEDKAYAFDCGADQYMTKPFDLAELLSRVKNLLARQRRKPAAAAPPQAFRFENVTVDPRRFQIRVGDESTELTAMELQLLRYFIENEGVVLTRQQILRDVWEAGSQVGPRTIDNFVMRLRKLIEPDPGQPRYLLSVRGAGYRFVADVTTVTDGEPKF